MTSAEPLQRALALPKGARFYKCALQVNPLEYLKRHHKPTAFKDEESYNKAIVEACQQHGIEVIAVADHYHARSAETLWQVAKDAGLHVFPGFEAVTKEGVHLLCLFDPDRTIDELERIIGDCGIHDLNSVSPTGEHDVLECLERSRDKWNAVCIAAHVASKGGLLKSLHGQARMRVWKSLHLLACSLPGPVSDAPDDLRPILENKNPDYRRDRPLAILNVQDVSGPEDLERLATSCYIKMSEISVEGLRQAFLDPISRIRLYSDPLPEEHIELIAMAWQGGFLDDQAIHFNENLNVIIGGRGAGKSTVVESIRYALGLEPLGDDARKIHDGIVRQVLKSGTKISLLVRSHRPAKRTYRIERTVPNPSVVWDEQGQVLNLTPHDIIPRIEVYGQHEISELTKNSEKLTLLLERFIDGDRQVAHRKQEILRELERSRTRIIETHSELQRIDDRLATLPALEETLQRFQEAGLEDRLKEQSLLVREERVLTTIPERIAPFRELLEQMQRELPIDRIFLSAKALEDLPGKDILTGADVVLDRLSVELDQAAGQITMAIERAERDITAIRQRWEVHERTIISAYERILRELQKSRVDGEEFIRLRRQIEQLRPLQERQKTLQRYLTELEVHRRGLHVEWEDMKAEQFRHLERAARKVTRQLANRVRVRVTYEGNRDPLFALLREQVGGRLSAALDALRKCETLSLKELTDALRAGGGVVTQKFGISPSQANRLAQASPETMMRIEELDLPPTTKIELNLVPEGQPPDWIPLENLSTGQKATAVLLLLLLESDAPLIVDQPEDDLDNRFITEGVVPKLREEKRRRQFVFATHNANIPVLGDAELIVGLRPSGEAAQGHADIPIEHIGSIDARAVRELVGELLEGGREAFEMRRLKYGF